MMEIKYLKTPLFVALIFLVAVIFAWGAGAQSEVIQEDQQIQPQTTPNSLNKDLVNCFEYYHFPGVEANIIAKPSNALAAQEITFSGEIKNPNTYPIVAGTLYVKIMDSNFSNFNGFNVVDQFVAKDDISIPAMGSTPVSFKWKVPSVLMSGKYQIMSFFIVDKKFNLLGLSFTDDITGNYSQFFVKGQDADVYLSKGGVTINDQPFFFAAFPNRVETGKPAVISVNLINDTDQDQDIMLNWNLYKWDSIAPENFLRKVSESVLIKANSSKKVSFTVNEADDPVYYIVAQADYKDKKSFLNMRFVRPAIDKLRINFPSIIEFPLKKDQPNALFSCLHNSGSSAFVAGGKLSIKISDDKGRTITDYIYEGSVSGSMMAVKKDFTPKRNSDHFFLTAQLWQGDKLVNQSKLEYDCNKIDPALCFPKSNWLSIVLYIITGLVLIGASVWAVLKLRKNQERKK